MNKSQQQNPQIPPKPTNINDVVLNKTLNTKPNNNNLTYLTKMNDNNKKDNRKIWDCGSTLYDSFELDSFRKQIDSAIVSSSRTLSMPRLPSQHPQVPTKKPSSSSKFSRNFQKLLRTVFRGSRHDKNKTMTPGNSGTASPDPWFFDSPVSYEDKSDVNGLSSIPEVNEEFGSSSSLVRKTMSERFTITAAPLGIRCS